MARFEFETLLDCPPTAIFDYLLRPANVAKMADPSTGLKIVSGPEVVEVGSQIAFQLVVLGKVQSAVHKITELVHPSRVVEQQIQGPLKSWTQQHLYEAKGSGVRMVDIIDFEPPGGILGFIATPERISDSLEEGFYARQQRLERLVANGGLGNG
jgi:ligand-binding SRPBCC domain-containing protein